MGFRNIFLNIFLYLCLCCYLYFYGLCPHPKLLETATEVVTGMQAECR